MFLRQGLRGLMPADLSRFLTVRGWIVTPVARRRVVEILTDDLNRCLRAVSLMNLSWTAVVDLGRPDLGLFFTEPVWRNFALILNTVALCTPARIAACSAVAPFSSIPIMRALTSTEMILPGMLHLTALRKISCKHATISMLKARRDSDGARGNAVVCSECRRCNFFMVTLMRYNRSIRLTAQTYRNFKGCKI